MSIPAASPLVTPGTARRAEAPRTASAGLVGRGLTKDGKGVGEVSANAPRAPFRVGEVPRACWCCIEVVFDYPTEGPEYKAKAFNLTIPKDTDPAAFAKRHGFAREYATEETLAAIAACFDEREGRERGVCVTRDHAGLNEDQYSRAVGWIRALRAEGEQLWAWVEWTPWGHEMVNGGEYIHFSTEYDYREFSRSSYGMSPTHLTGCTVTNQPRHCGQVPCTNSERRPLYARNTFAGNPGTHPNMNTEEETAKNSAGAPAPAEDNKPEATNAHGGRMLSFRSRNNDGNPEEEQPAAANAATPEEEEAALNSQQVKPATAANSETLDPEPAMNDENTPAAEPLVEIASMLGLPNTATPEDVVAAVGDLQRSNEELTAALAEANQGAAPSTATNSARRYPNLTMRNSSRVPLVGQRPNREVSVRVGSGVRAINAQAKSKSDFCANAVTREERLKGRPLTPKEFADIHGAAMRDYEAGVGR